MERSPKIQNNMKHIAKISGAIAIFLFAILLVAPVAFAQGTIPSVLPGGEGDYGQDTIGGWVSILITIVRWFYTIIFIIAVLFILLAAWNFITSKGDPTKTKTARGQLLWAVIGIAVALISYTIIYFVRSALITGGQ